MTSPFGLLAFLHWNHDWNNWHFPPNMLKRAIAQLKELRVSTLRVDLVWSDIHRGLYQYDFSTYDQLIGELTDAGFELLIPLHYNKVRLAEDGKEIWNTPPESTEEFARYVEATVRRYKSKVRHWEIWNEPNHPVYWTGPKDNLRAYGRLLRQSTTAAKNADPSCVVLNGGLTEPVVESVKDLYTHVGKEFFDILSIHTFLDPSQRDVQKIFNGIIEGTRKLMVANGDEGKKIWITEMGCPGVASSNVKNWWIGRNPTETEQADWLEKEYGMIKPFPFVEKLFWAFYRDTENVFQDGVDYFGLVRHDLMPKPAFERLKRLTHR